MKVRRIDFYPDDWIAGTIHLNHLERSVYISIIAGIYAVGGPVELDYVKKLCPGRGFARGLEGLLRCSKVTLEGTRLSQSRALTELERSTSRTDKWRENGAKGGRPNGLAEPKGFPEPRARPRDNHHSSFINHHSSKEGDSKNGKWKKAQPPLDHVPGHFSGCQCPGCERLAQLAADFERESARVAHDAGERPPQSELHREEPAAKSEATPDRP